MSLAALVLSLVLALAMLVSGGLKIVRAPRIVRLMAVVGVPPQRLPVLGALQVAGAVGLLGGLAWPLLGIAAATGLVLYFAGAVAAHLRVHDPARQGAVMFLILSGATLVALVLAG